MLRFSFQGIYLSEDLTLFQMSRTLLWKGFLKEWCRGQQRIVLQFREKILTIRNVKQLPKPQKPLVDELIFPQILDQVVGVDRNFLLFRLTKFLLFEYFLRGPLQCQLMMFQTV
uniref:Uncharacterized protein n=1 Tax=Cacopsylla melanoneura TaxID=428564 RepID=A0A8D8VWG9_9HEMI